MVFPLKPLRRLHHQPAADVSVVDTACALTRRFVLTGDERCPIAGIWSRLDESPLADATDEPSLTPPAVGRLSWRAIHLLFMSLRYLPA